MSVADVFVIVGHCKMCGEQTRSNKPRLMADAKKGLSAFIKEPPLHGSPEGCFGVIEIIGLELHTPE
jgi:hypothetical protein